MRTQRKYVIGFVVGALVSSVLGTSAASGAATPTAPLTPGGKASQAAVDQIGASLPAVAAEHGFSQAQLRAELLRDPTLKVDKSNKLFYVEPAAPIVAGAAAAAADSVFDTTIPPANAFLLNSKPGANRVIYLDFDGQMISGTAWNNAAGGDCAADPYDSDKLPATFSNAERTQIISIWKRVSEDYAAFDVNVTTQDPGVDALYRSSSTDLTFGTRALITKSTSLCPNGKTFYQSVCTNGCGGVAYVGIFDRTADNGFYQPALVFVNGVGAGAKTVAEATSHEVGHNAGLGHDGTVATATTAASGYYGGHGSWAPIMGVGYYKAISQWSKGEYANANNTQDDFAVAVGKGLPLRPDDHGDTAAAATVLSGTNPGLDGLISTRTDIDAFAVAVGAGPATFTVNPATTSPNLDVKLELRDRTGVLVASADAASGSTSSDNATGMGASITATLTQGTYTLFVDGVGYGNPLGGTVTPGYSDYGSVGNYRLSGTVVAPVGSAPVPAVTATPTSGTAPLTVAFIGSGSTDPDGSGLTYSWDFGDGTASTETNPSHVYQGGAFTARLTVTDADGYTATAAQTITVTRPIDVAATTLTMAKTTTTTASGTATVTVQDNLGNPVSGAGVTGAWTYGTKTIIKSVNTGTNGVASITSGNLTVSNGQVVKFCVTNLARSGAVWSSGLFAPITATDCQAWTVG